MKQQPSNPSVSPARRAAFDILRRVETEGAYAAVLISALPQSALSREDRALAQEITLGVLRHRLSLDYFIERYARRSIKRLDIAVLIALRMGLYQLRHLTRIPHSAAVNESVNLVKRARAKSAAPMVNAVLRNAARHLDDQPGEDRDDRLERLAIETSHPAWLLERWIKAFGESEARALAMANNETPLMGFRVNTLRAEAQEVIAQLEREGVTVRSSEIAPGAFVSESGGASLARAAERGTIYIQDEASLLVSLLIEPKRGERLLDLCAAPGSKSSHLAALTDDAAWIVACDLHPHRLVSLKASAERLGIKSINAVALDATRTLPFMAGAPRFDRVLIDAPCTGTGTLRRNPEIKWRLATEDISRLPNSIEPACAGDRSAAARWAAGLFDLFHRARRKRRGDPSIHR